MHTVSRKKWYHHQLRRVSETKLNTLESNLHICIAICIATDFILLLLLNCECTFNVTSGNWSLSTPLKYKGTNYIDIACTTQFKLVYLFVCFFPHFYCPVLGLVGERNIKLVLMIMATSHLHICADEVLCFWIS